MHHNVASLPETRALPVYYVCPCHSDAYRIVTLPMQDMQVDVVFEIFHLQSLALLLQSLPAANSST